MTVAFTVKEMDAGPVLAQQKVQVDPEIQVRGRGGMFCCMDSWVTQAHEHQLAGPMMQGGCACGAVSSSLGPRASLALGGSCLPSCWLECGHM